MKNIIKRSLTYCFVLITFSCNHTNEKKSGEIIYSNLSIDSLFSISKESNSMCCIVLYEPERKATELYKQKLEVESLDCFFNFVDISSPENRWYEQLFCPSNYPQTCIFNTKGELIDMLNGSSNETFSYLRETIINQKQINNNLRSILNIDKQDFIQVMNKLLQSKLELEAGINPDNRIDDTFKYMKYPYNILLKIEQERMFGNPENLFTLANELLSLEDSYNYLVYTSGFISAKEIIHADYLQKAPRCKITFSKELFDNCKLNQTIGFYVEIENEGKYPLILFEILTGCGCLKYIGEKEYVISGMEKCKLPFEFTPDIEGEIERTIHIICNDIEQPVQEIEICAQVYL